MIYSRAYDEYHATKTFLKNLEIPFILYGSTDQNRLQQIEGNYFLTQNEQLTSLALNHLAEAGHQNIGIMCTGYYPDTARLTAWKTWYQERRGSFREDFIMELGKDWLSTLKNFSYDTTRFVKYFSSITALYCTGDSSLPTLLPHLAKQGIRVPDDLSIVGVNNSYFCQLSDPAITSVEIPMRQHGALLQKSGEPFIRSRRKDYFRFFSHSKSEGTGNFGLPTFSVDAVKVLPVKISGLAVPETKLSMLPKKRLFSITQPKQFGVAR